MTAMPMPTSSSSEAGGSATAGPITPRMQAQAPMSILHTACPILIVDHRTGLLRVALLPGASYDHIQRRKRKIHFRFTYFQRRREGYDVLICLLYTSPSPRDRQKSRMPSSA